MGLRDPDANDIRSGAAASRSRPGTALALGVDAVHAGRDLRVGQLYHLYTHGGTYSTQAFRASLVVLCDVRLTRMHCAVTMPSVVTHADTCFPGP